MHLHVFETLIIFSIKFGHSVFKTVPTDAKTYTDTDINNDNKPISTSESVMLFL